MTSSQDQMFTTAVSRTPESLRPVLQQSGLASAGVLRNFKRDSSLTLKLDPEDKRHGIARTAWYDGSDGWYDGSSPSLFCCGFAQVLAHFPIGIIAFSSAALSAAPPARS